MQITFGRDTAQPRLPYIAVGYRRSAVRIRDSEIAPTEKLNALTINTPNLDFFLRYAIINVSST